MADQLSGVAVIIFIAFGVLTFLLLFIFANRQIKRFSLKSRSGPHALIAGDASKTLQIEIDRRLDVVKAISYQPKLLKKHEEQLFLASESEICNLSPLHLYRMKVLDYLHVLESSIISTDPVLGQLFSQSLRLCLMRFFQKGFLHNIDSSIVHQFVDLYEFSRHEPGEFNHASSVQFMGLLEQIINSLSPVYRQTQPNGNSKQYLSVPSPMKSRISSSATEELTRPLFNGEKSTLPITVVPDSPQTEEEEEEKKDCEKNDNENEEENSEKEEDEEEKKATYETSV